MKHIAFAVMVVVLVAVCSLVGAPGTARAQAFGMISATVEKTDDARGLTVRSDPSDTASPVGYLPVGTEIKSCNDFKDGWVRLENPSKGNWVKMAFLKPKGGEGTVAEVDKPDLCLPIRKGPYSSYEKIGCAELGQKLKLSGVWSSTNWARLEDGGWVDATKIQTDLFVCSAPPGATPESQPEPAAQAPAQPPVATQSEPVVVAEPLPVVSDYPGCAAYGSACPPIGVGCLPAPVILGDFGAFGYYPGVYPFISIGVGPFGGYYRNAWRDPYHNGNYGHYGHHGDRWHQGQGQGGQNGRRSNIANARGNNRTANVNSFSRNTSARVNRSVSNATNSVRSNAANAGFARGSYGSGFRSMNANGFRAQNFSRNRGMNMASFSNRSFRSAGRSFRGGSFSGGSFRGASFRGGGGAFHGGGRRR